jgi:FGGY-family pentulose kinase
METLVVGVDVGTGSARAGVFTMNGEMLGRAEHSIRILRRGPNEAEHDSTDIWRAVCLAVRGAMAEAKADPLAVHGLAFDATCSLVLRDGRDSPLRVSDGEPGWDTFVWHDHRAIAEAAECTATGHRILDHLGGVMSPEMEIPKLMWLKRHRPEAWDRLRGAYDLADWLTFRATGYGARSISTLATKWNFLAHEADGWPADFLAEVGLSDLFEKCGLPKRPVPPGEIVGPLTEAAADDLGLTTIAQVAAGLVDAHAGALGVLAPYLDEGERIDRHLALIAGTSNSILALAPDERQIRGIWGPSFAAVVPDLWLSEGGQSAAGGLLDHLIRWHGAGGEPSSELHAAIVARIGELQAAEPNLAPDLHVLPDFLGNRSPIADPSATGAIIGLTLAHDFDSLCRLYWRAAVALAVGLRQIVETFGANGFGTTTLHAAGGHTRNPLLLQLYADATGCTIVEPDGDPVLLGSAMIASVGVKHGTVREAARVMQRPGTPRSPNRDKYASYDRDYRIMLELQRQRDVIRAI